MTKRTNPHLGSSFKSWLDEHDIREEVTAAAIKRGGEDRRAGIAGGVGLSHRAGYSAGAGGDRRLIRAPVTARSCPGVWGLPGTKASTPPSEGSRHRPFVAGFPQQTGEAP